MVHRTARKASRERLGAKAPAWLIADFKVVGSPPFRDPHAVNYAAMFSVVFADHERLEGWSLHVVPKLDRVTSIDSRRVALGAFLEAPPRARADARTLKKIRRTAFVLWLAFGRKRAAPSAVIAAP